MRGVVKKWGNGAAVRIPGGILEAAHLKIDMPVDIREEAGRILIEPVSAKAFDAATLIAAITSKNVHAAQWRGACRSDQEFGLKD